MISMMTTHHPTEITSILEGVRNVYKKRNIVTIFEPHRYSREFH